MTAVVVQSAPTLEALLMDIDTELAKMLAFFEAQDMQIGAGITKIGEVIEGCCDHYFTDSYPVIVYTTTTDADGNVTSTPSTINLTGVPSLQSYTTTQAIQNSQNAEFAWQAKWEKWHEEYKNWRNATTGLYFAQVLADAVIAAEMLGLRRDFLNCAKEALETLKTTHDCLHDDLLATVKPAHETHMASVNTKAATEMEKACAVLDKMAENAVYLNNQFTLEGDGGGMGWEKMQTDHVENMGTHLAQLCTNGRDASDDLRTIISQLDDTWANGGGWKTYEACLEDLGEGGFAAALKNGADKAAEICEYLNECGQMMAKCYYDADNPANSQYISVIKPVMDALVMQMGEAGGVIEELTETSKSAKACADDIKARYDTIYKTGENTISPLILGQAESLFSNPDLFADCHTFLTECAGVYKEGFERYLGEDNGDMSSGEMCLGRAIIDQACGLVNNLQQAVTFIGQYKEDCLDIYKTTYQGNEEALQVAVLQSATDMVTCVQATKTWLQTHSEAMDACYEAGYAGEKAWAAGLFEQATELEAKHTEMFQWLCDCAIEIKQCWSEDYKPGEKILAADVYEQAQALAANFVSNNDWFEGKSEEEFNCWLQDYQPREKTAQQEIMDEGIALANCLSLTHEWLCTQADKTYEHWCEFWVPKEEEYVCAVLDKAILLSCESYECLTEWCELADTQFDWWKTCYEEVECINLPKLISAIDPACNKNIELYAETCDRSAKQYDEWCEHYAPCDLDDLAKHCEIWDKVNPLEEICDNNDCVQSLGEILKNCYTDLVLPCEKAYIDEICNLEKYDPRYCELEDRAVAHVRKQYSESEDKLRRQFSKYCKGALLDSLQQLDGERIKTEAASIQAADRWEWWREMQECDRRHRYKLDIFGVGERYATNSMQAYQQSTVGNDLILGRVHERIMRGFQWLNHSEQNAQQTYGAIANAMNFGLDATRVGHFWPQWWTDNRDRYLNHVDNRLDDATQLMQIGQAHNNQAMQSKVQAGQMALGAIDRTHTSINQGHNINQQATNDRQLAQSIVQQAIQNAQNTVGLGHAQLDRAINTKVQAERVIEAVQDDAQQAVQLGHYFIDSSFRDQNKVMDTALQSIDDGAVAVNQGLDHKRRALEAASLEAQHANAGIGSGLNSISQGHDLARMGMEAKQIAINEAIAVWGQYTNQLEYARGLLQTALDYERLATSVLQNQQQQGMNAAEFGLANFNAANRKVEVAQSAAQTATGQALDLYGRSLARQGNVLQGLNSETAQVASAVGTFTNFISEGNRTFLGGALASTAQEASLRKQCMQYLCDKITQDTDRYMTNSIRMSNSIFGLSYQAANDAQNQVLDSAAGVFAGINGIIGPPPAFNQFFGGGQTPGGNVPVVGGITSNGQNLGSYTNYSSK